MIPSSVSSVLRGRYFSLALMMLAISPLTAFAQGPSPESALTQFPGGAFISYNSIFESRALVPGVFADTKSPTARPTFMHQGIFRVAWSPKTNWELMAVAPIVTQHLDTPAANVGGTGFGDITLLILVDKKGVIRKRVVGFDYPRKFDKPIQQIL